MRRPYQTRKRGRSYLLGAPYVFGIVGSRSASREACAIASRSAQALVDEGVVVASGLARGVDTYAHVGALRRRGSTIAFIASDFDVPYPPENEALQREIGEKHLLVTLALEGQSVSRDRLLTRNKVLAQSVCGLLVVTARVQSGTMSTARHALGLGCPVFIVERYKQEDWAKVLLDRGAITVSSPTELRKLSIEKGRDYKFDPGGNRRW